MVGSIRLFLLLMACFLVVSVTAAHGGPAYLIETDVESLSGTDLGVLKDEPDGSLRLAARVAKTVFLHAAGTDLERLEEVGIAYDLITEESPDLEYYIVRKAPGAEYALEWSEAEVLLDRPAYFLVSVKPEAAFMIHELPNKRRLTPADAARPLELTLDMPAGAPAAEPFTYSPAVQALVDSVSESRLYTLLNELSGETPVVVDGETYTLHTRYSPTDLSKVAGHYLRETFEGLGLATELHFFNFRSTLNSIYFPTGNQEGWSVGRVGKIIHTADGGLVWEAQDSDLDVVLNDVFMIDNYIGCIAGEDGEILWTDDGGATWNHASDPTSVNLNKVHMTDSNTGYCCGNSGVILKTTDGGANWSYLSSGTSRDLNGIVFLNATDGWAVGASGKIIRTTNAGASWNSVSSPTSDDLMDITFVGDVKGWISTESGSVLRTEDGATWEELATPAPGSLLSICFAPNGLTGWACGNVGSMIKTTDGGDTWADMSNIFDVLYADIFFLDANEGWFCGTGYLHHTVNGGADWESQTHNVLAGDINVIATLPGSVSPDEIYIICGHYDSISNNPYYDAPGADDNGTGTIAVVEAARILRELQFEATIRFVCFSREEQGLVGSTRYVNMIAERGDSVVGALNFDMIGYEDEHPEDVEIIYDDISFSVANAFKQAADLYVPDLGYRLRHSPNTTWSDHASFWDNGYPAFCGIEDSPVQNPYYHRTTDRIGTVDFDFYGDVVRAAVGTLAELARIDSVSAGVPEVAAASGLRVLPNPCIGGARVELSGRVSPDTEIEFYSVEGRLVGRVRPEAAGGRATAVWSAEDANGEPLSPGIYFVRVAGTERAEKIILLK